MDNIISNDNDFNIVDGRHKKQASSLSKQQRKAARNAGIPIEIVDLDAVTTRPNVTARRKAAKQAKASRKANRR